MSFLPVPQPDDQPRPGLPSLPSLDGLLAGLGLRRWVPAATAAPLTEEAILGRDPIAIEDEGIRALLEGRRVLITGAGGSIGSEAARQVHSYRPAQLTLVDRDESLLADLALDLPGLPPEALVLADIRDATRIHRVMNDTAPDVVIHAAALKHVSFLQRFPDEAIKTNVFGTRNVVTAAADAGVGVLVNISTDKAADPSNALGYSKRIAERITAGITPPAARYMSVRFGNVLGSRGSVLPIFRRQIARGGPVTVTHPDVTRYFMTIPEAVHLVLQASLIGEPGQTLILDMGTPVRIDDVARFMIEHSGRDVPLTYTGLKPGEKLHEVLAASSEDTRPTSHPQISHVTVAPLPVADLPRRVGPRHASTWLQDWATTGETTTSTPPAATSPAALP